MNVKDLLNHIDSFAPFSLAEEWDNSGLIVGSINAEVKKAAVALDAVSEAVIEAGRQGCNVLVCHHPLIFRPLKHVCTDDDTGRTIAEAVRRNITIIAAHTNWDKADGGVNDTLASLLGLKDTEPLTGNFGVRGICPEGITPEHIKSSWQLSRLDIYAGHMPEKFSRAALCGGSGAEFWRAAKDWGADIYITADMKYHELIDAARAGLVVAVADHGEMERASLPELARKISLSGIDTVLPDVNALPIPLRF